MNNRISNIYVYFNINSYKYHFEVFHISNIRNIKIKGIAY